MSLEPENTEAPERAPVPGGYIERMPGEGEEAFGKRADAVRLERAELKKRVDAEHRMTWREHMARCYAEPLGERPEQPELQEWMRGTGPARHPQMLQRGRPRTPEEESMLARANHTRSSGYGHES